MPVDPNHPYADTPHPKTVQPAGWTYGCHSSKIGPAPRGKPSRYVACGPTRPVIVRTGWLPKPCGHSERATDAQCAGCVNRSDRASSKTLGGLRNAR